MTYYYLDDAGEVVGPISDDTLKELQAAGTLKAGTQICQEGTEQWVGLHSVLDSDSRSPVEAAALKFSCPSCSQHIAAETSAAGRITQCPSCGAEIQVPGLEKAVGNSAVVSPAATSRSGKPKNKKAVVLGGVGGLLALVVVIVVVAWKLGGTGGGASTTSESYKEAISFAWEYLDEIDDVNGMDDTNEALEENWKNAVKALKKTANGGTAEAHAVLALVYLERGEEEESANWLSRLNKSAEEGTAEAQYFMGVYSRLNGDKDEFAKWITRSAYQDYAPAQRELGLAFQKGRQGVGQSREEGFSWLQKALENGDTDALYDLAESYREGIGVSKSVQKAVEYYKKSADHGDIRSMEALFSLYAKGSRGGVEKNPEEAISWLKMAAENGDSYSQQRLAFIYARGELTPRDPEQSVAWLKKAANNGDEFSMFILGKCYINGFVVTPNQAEAQKWITRATEKGQTSVYSEHLRLFQPETHQQEDNERNREAVQNFKMRYRIAQQAEGVGPLEKILGTVDSMDWTGIGSELRKAVDDVKAIKTGDSKEEVSRRLQRFSDLCDKYE